MYPIGGVRSEIKTMQDAGFPVQLIERPGTHYDDSTATSGTDYDLQTYLLPHLGDGWRSSQRGPRGFRGPRGHRGFTGAPGPAGAAGPSDGFVISIPQATDLPGGTDTVVAQLSVPAGATYIVNASTDLGNATNTPSPISCTLLQNSNPLTSGSASLPGQLLFAATIALNTAVDAANGTNVKLSCNPDSSAKARNSVITAIRVGTLHTETAATP